MRSVVRVVGVVMLVLGVVFFLQGINVFPGSGMSGKTLWAVLGPIIAVVGVVLIVFVGKPDRLDRKTL